MSGYVWAWLKDDGSGYVHHPLVYADEATARETWASETIPDDAPTRRRMGLYRLVPLPDPVQAAIDEINSHWDRVEASLPESAEKKRETGQ